MGGLRRFYCRYLFFATASGWLTAILLALFVIANGWFTQIRWHCVLASGWLAQFHLISFTFFSFTCSASGWPVFNQWVVYTVFLLFLFFPFSAARFGKRLAWSEPHPRFVCFVVGTNWDLEESYSSSKCRGLSVASSPETRVYVTDVTDRVSLPATSSKIDSVDPFESDNFNVSGTIKGNSIVHSLKQEQL